MNFDDKPVIYIITNTDAAFNKLAKAMRAIECDVHFPQTTQFEALLTHNPESVAALIVDLDIDTASGLTGVDLLKGIKEIYALDSIAHAYQAPIIAVSENEELSDTAKNAGAEMFMHKGRELEQTIFTALVSLEDLMELDLRAAHKVFPNQDNE